MIHNDLKFLLEGFNTFHEKYKLNDTPSTKNKPKFLVVSCCDSRTDPAILFQCDPGDLLVVRNIANIVPPCEDDNLHHGTSAALEFGIKYLNIQHLIIIGHTECAGIEFWINNKNNTNKESFLKNWTSIINVQNKCCTQNECAKESLINSYKNCLTFPWIKDNIEKGILSIHLLFFDVNTLEILYYDFDEKIYKKFDFCQ